MGYRSGIGSYGNGIQVLGHMGYRFGIGFGDIGLGLGSWDIGLGLGFWDIGLGLGFVI